MASEQTITASNIQWEGGTDVAESEESGSEDDLDEEDGEEAEESDLEEEDEEEELPLESSGPALSAADLNDSVSSDKNANSYPVDRIPFSYSHVRAYYFGESLKQVPIQEKNCEVCGLSDRVGRLHRCDGCDAKYHMACLTPPLNAIPLEWFCPECVGTDQSADE